MSRTKDLSLKLLRFSIPGILFGIVMTKSEAVSWYRIQEMFLFESFHMYGIIGVAVVAAMIMTFVMKRSPMRSMTGQPIHFAPKRMSIPRYLIGGIVFGLGWSMIGACPGPMFTLIGHGVWSMLIVIAAAMLGTYVYGLLRSRLPH